jgi:anti-sigma regulatory factor (Ser/Thr protein kinase)
MMRLRTAGRPEMKNMVLDPHPDAWIQFGEVGGMRFMLRVESNAGPATVRLIRKLVAAAARVEGVPDLEAHLIEVAIGEVLAHGRSERENTAPGPVTMSVEFHGGRLIVSVAERRHAPRQIDMPADSEDDYALGWGLYIISQVMDEIEIRQPVKRGHTAELRLVKRFG